MKPLTALIAYAFYLLSIAAPEALIEQIPDCKEELKSRAIQNHRLRVNLAVEVMVAKAQQVQGPVYTCELENKTHGYVNIPPGGPIPWFGNNVVHANGDGGQFNIEKIVNGWRERLREMGRKTQFGCNLFLGDTYAVACVFE